MSTKKEKKTETKTTKSKATKTTPKTVATLNKITFTLEADAVDNIETVAVLGSFNDWNLNKALYLTKEKDGSFKGTIELVKGNSYEYRFLVNNTLWVNDNNATQFVTTPFGVENCVLIA